MTELKWYTRKWLFNRKEGNSGETKESKGHKKYKNKQKIGRSSFLLVITLNINVLNSSIKRKDWQKIF